MVGYNHGILNDTQYSIAYVHKHSISHNEDNTEWISSLTQILYETHSC